MTSISEIEYVEFGLYGDEDHKVQSKVQVVSNNLISGGVPERGGLYDPKLGTTDYDWLCDTCYKNRSECTGHPGLLELNCPLEQPIGISEIRRWLKILCHGCSRPIVDPIKYARVPVMSRLAEASQTSTDGKKCGYQDCGKIHPKVLQSKEDNFTFFVQQPESTTKSTLYAYEIAQIFERVTDDTVIAFGKTLENHPRKLVLSKFIQVPPVTVRPSVRSAGPYPGNSNNDINGMLAHIVTRNASIDSDLVARRQIDEHLDKTISNFQQFYYDMIQGSTAVTVNSTGKRTIILGTKPVTSFLKMQSRKQGRIRSNLLRKKVCYICRQTISGNSQLKLNHLVIPLSFARTLSVLEHVQEFNKDYLMTFFLNRRKRYPGAVGVIKKSNGQFYKIENIKDDFVLEVGDILERDVITGDVCIFNRQPSLEICSMGCHEVVVNEDPDQRTIQMNVSICSNYNADFDGDEMNLFVPKDPMTRAEVRHVSHVDNFFISTKNSNPQNGQVQDGNIGCALMTMYGDPDTSELIMDKHHALSMFKIPGFKLPQLDAKKKYTGRDVMSMLLQRTPINFSGKPTFLNDNFSPFMKYHKSDTFTVIKNGIIESGVLDKKSVGPKAGRGVFHIIGQNYGNIAALDAIYNMQQVVLSFLQYYGFTVSTSDIMLPESARDEIQQHVEQVLLESQTINDDLMEGKITPPIIMTTHEFYEKKQINALKINDEDLLRILLTNIDPHNNSLFKMISTGSKGIIANMIHIMAALQQITINGERIQPNFGHSRALPYFGKFATQAEAYGFIKNSYIVGMTSWEFIFASMHGRFDLINKALSTSSTGHHFRKSYMSLQSVIIDYYRRTSKKNRVVQILYGDDGLDPRSVEKVDFYTIPMSEKAIMERCLKAKTPRADDQIKMIISDRDSLRKSLMRLESGHFNRPFETYLSVPVNVRRAVDQTITIRTSQPKNFGSLDDKIDMVNDFCRKVAYIYFNEKLEQFLIQLPTYIHKATTQMQILIRMELCPAVLEGLTVKEVESILGLVRVRYTNALIQYGDMVSAKAAQAICEPLTQHFLDSHHRSVSGGTSKSSLDQIKQIFSDRPIEKEVNTRMLVRIKDPVNKYDKAYVQKIANSIELITFRRFASSTAILFESVNNLRYPPFKNDKEWLDDFKKTSPFMQIPKDLSNWCIRFELSKKDMVLKEITLDRIIERIKLAHSSVFVVNSKESNPKIVVRVYVSTSFFNKKVVDEEQKIRQFKDQLLNTMIRGIKGIFNVEVKKIIRHKVDTDGSLVKDHNEYAIETSGANIADLLLNEFIDKNTLISTSIRDTLRVLGIEAARQKIINETIRFMEDNVPNERHIKIYADEMTLTGKITSIERKGMNAREYDNVLLRAAYCAPSQVFTDASLNNIKGPVYGLAAPRLVGGTPHIGTLYSDVSVDDQFVRDNGSNINKVLDDILDESFEIDEEE